jgi:protein-S-isoprenylcysteine O-methyltransferase Ste14
MDAGADGDKALRDEPGPQCDERFPHVARPARPPYRSRGSTLARRSPSLPRLIPAHEVEPPMGMLLRHALSILLLPTMVAVVIPRWILRTYAAVDTRWPFTPPSLVPRALGVMLVLAGVALVAWCISLFARVGKGTLAPWDPTANLVAVGPYRYTRNPMITGVLTTLVGEALVTGSRLIGLWALVFFAMNHTYFLLLEEPGLSRRFGDSYDEYKRTVPRWLPRLRR